ncbi:DHH family phosphoesterase [Candidatus Pacearchaeota archaeon]|nr:DHH family phosphoesterase [Candidatus Pacearchaeota archaeon]
MLPESEINEIREHLNNTQNPLFLFDNDVDGFCSFLLFRRYIGRGNGVAIRSYPELNKSYMRKIDELKPDYVFILDKPVVSMEFIDEIKQRNIPIVWIDHHESPYPLHAHSIGHRSSIEDRASEIDYEGINYYNPLKYNENFPVTYLAYNVVNNKRDLWIGVLGCIADIYKPEFMNEFNKQYPELACNNNDPFYCIYETELGKAIRIIDFALKDKTSNVTKMIRYAYKMNSPYDILKENKDNYTIIKRFNEIDKKYQKLIKKALEHVEGDLIFFTYGGEFSISANISNELVYRYPDKLIVVAYLKDNKINISLRWRNNDVRKLTAKVLEGLEGASGGGHEHATGAQILVKDLDEFKRRVAEYLRENR